MTDKCQNHKDFREVNGGTHAFGGGLDRITVDCGGAAALVEGVEGGRGLVGIEEDGGAEGEVILGRWEGRVSKILHDIASECKAVSSRENVMKEAGAFIP